MAPERECQGYGMKAVVYARRGVVIDEKIEGGK